MNFPFKEKDAAMIMQVCFVTDDIGATVDWFAKLLGKEVPRIFEPNPAELETQYFGQSAHIGFKQAIMRWRGTQLEFIQPDQSPSVWRDWMNEHGSGIHHVGFAVDDFDAARSSLESAGLQIVQEGSFPRGRYAYADARAIAGSFVEILDVDVEDVKAHGMA